jgi:Tfp pilus assembly protein PilF
LNIFDRLYNLVIPLICGLMKRLMEPLAIPLGKPKTVAKCLVMMLCVGQIAYADDIQDANRLFKEGQHSQALDKVNGYLANKPKDAQARFLKGLIFTEQGRSKDAIKIFSGLTDDYPNLPEPYNNLAVLYASQGQYEKAKMELEMAIRTHPSYAIAHDNLGDIYAKMASDAYDRALQLDNHNTSTQTKLVMINDLFRDGIHGQETSASMHSDTVQGQDEATAPAVKAEKSPVATQSVLSSIVAANPVPAVPTALPDQNKEVLEAVNAWAAAWSSQDANKYLSFYAADFKIPNNESRSDWETSRHERVTNPKFIQVSVSNAKVKFSDTEHATVSFRQLYRASHHTASGKKILLMVKYDGNWLIQEERTR